jgi:chorismate synthase
MLRALGVRSAHRVVALGGIEDPTPFDWGQLERIEASPVRVLDPEVEARIIARIDAAKAAGDTLGGVVEARFSGLVPGLGSYSHYDRKLDGRLAQMVMSIPSVKGFEVGEGYANAARPGSEVHDAIYWEADRGFYRKTNRAGGLEAGMTTGEELVLRAAMKPIATLMRPLPTVDLVTKAPADAARERSDVTAVPAGAVILEALAAIVLAQAYLEKFGGDTWDEVLERVAAYRDRVRRF